MVIGLFDELLTIEDQKFCKNCDKKNYEFYVTFDTFGRLYSWKWLGRIL